MFSWPGQGLPHKRPKGETVRHVDLQEEDVPSANAKTLGWEHACSFKQQ